MSNESTTDTPFDVRCAILSEVWLHYREQEDFLDFVTYNDLGLPLAYLIDAGVVEAKSDTAVAFVNETFELLLSALDLDDIGYNSLSEMLDLE